MEDEDVAIIFLGLAAVIFAVMSFALAFRVDSLEAEKEKRDKIVQIACDDPESPKLQAACELWDS